jgi:hypothetical protein
MWHYMGCCVYAADLPPPPPLEETETEPVCNSRNRRSQRRVTHHETRFHSEVRQEAVQQALAAMSSRPKPSLPMPSKRTSVMARTPDAETRDSDSASSDEDSIPAEGSIGGTPDLEGGRVPPTGHPPPPRIPSDAVVRDLEIHPVPSTGIGPGYLYQMVASVPEKTSI